MSRVICCATIAAFSALLYAQRGTATSIWHVHIDNGPAPGPADGPPISAHATRDHSLLKYQILGIVLGYFCFLGLEGLTLMFILRPLRRAALSPVNSVPGSASLQMTSAVQVADNGWRRGVRRVAPHRFLTKRAIQHNATGSAADSIVSVDYSDKVIEQNRCFMEEDLEKLYKVVVESEVRAPKRLSMEATGSDISPVQRFRESFGESHSLLKASGHAPSPRFLVASEDQRTPFWSAPNVDPHTVGTADRITIGNRSEAEFSLESVFSPESISRNLPRLDPITIPSKVLFLKKSATASSPTLPFRARDDVRMPLPTKLTLLSPWQGSFRGAPMRSAVWQPGMAGLATPYSPYMSLTPLTPVSPYLERRAERRQRERESARRAPTIEDEVMEEGEAWQCVG